MAEFTATSAVKLSYDNEVKLETTEEGVRISGDLTVNGKTTIVDTNVTTDEQLSITNDGTGPAVIVNQKGSQPIVNFKDDDTSVFFIKDGGNVGLGTDIPSVNLDIEGANNVIADLVTETADANTTIRFREQTNTTAAEVNRATIGYDGTNDGLILTTGDFTAGNGIFIDDNQKVGIGVSSSLGATLDINGDLRIATVLSNEPNNKNVLVLGAGNVVKTRTLNKLYEDTSATNVKLSVDSAGASVTGTLNVSSIPDSQNSDIFLVIDSGNGGVIKKKTLGSLSVDDGSSSSTSINFNDGDNGTGYYRQNDSGGNDELVGAIIGVNIWALNSVGVRSEKHTSIVGGGSSAPSGLNGLHLGYDVSSQTAHINAEQLGTSNRHLSFKAASYNFTVGNSTFAGDLTVGDSHFIGDDSFDNLAIISSSGENVVVAAANDIYLNTDASGGGTGTNRLLINENGVKLADTLDLDNEDITNINSAGFGNCTIFNSNDNNNIHVNCPTALIPHSTTASNNASLGTSTYRWKGLFSTTANLSGDLTVGGTLLHLSASDPTLKITDTSGSDNGATLWLQESDNFGAKVYYNSNSNTFFNISTIDGGTEDLRFSIKRTGETGIGTGAPRTTLHVVGPDSDDDATAASAAGAFLVSNSAGSYGIEMGVSSSGHGWIQSHSVANNNQYPLLLNPIGSNVGIGTTSPSTPLHVKGNIRAEASGSTAFADLKSSQIYASSTYDIIVGSNNPLFFRTNDTRRMTILGDGKVGIGTTTPTSLLHVHSGTFSSGEAEIRNDSRVNRNYKFTLGTTTKYIGTVQMNGNGDSSGFHVRIYDGQSKVWREVNVVVQNSGGTNFPKVTVEGGGDDVNINVEFAYVNRSGASQKTDFYLVPTSSKNFTQLVFVDGFIERDTGHSSTSSTNINLDTAVGIYKAATDDSSRIGIGTNNPSEKLHVLGNAVITGTLDVQSQIIAPNAPTNLNLSVVGETINVTFTASTTSNIDSYLVYSSVDGSDYGLISIIPPDDFGATMSIIDSAFTVTGTQAYRVYAVKAGKLSSALSGNISYTVSSAEPTNLSVVALNNAFYIQYDPPSSNSRFVTAYKIFKHEHANQGSLDRTQATEIYSGMNKTYMYQISGSNNTNFHQFWVETTIAT